MAAARWQLGLGIQRCWALGEGERLPPPLLLCRRRCHFRCRCAACCHLHCRRGCAMASTPLLSTASVQAGVHNGETFVYLNTSLIPTPSTIPNYYGKAAMVPSMAHKYGGNDGYKVR